MIFRSLTLAAVLAASATLATSGAALAAAPGGPAAGPSPSESAEAVRNGCLGEGKDWLPGALQVDDRAAGPAPPEAGPGAIEASASHDCALV